MAKPKPTKKTEGNNQLQGPPHELLKEFLSHQGKELEIRAQEVQLDYEREKNNKSVAEISIKANLEDRANLRDHFERSHKRSLNAILIGSGMAIAAVCYCLYLDKEALLLKVAEIVAVFLAGFLGGWGYKSTKDEQKLRSGNDILGE